MPSVVLEQVDREGNLKGRLLPRLSRLSLEQLGEVLIVVEQPVTQAPDPFAPAGRSERLPRRLVAPQPRDGSAHLPGAQIGQRGHHRSIRRRGHLEVRAPLRAVPRPTRTDRRRAHSRHLGVACAHQSPIVPPRARECESAPCPTDRRARTRSGPSPHTSLAGGDARPNPNDHDARDHVIAVVSTAPLRTPASDEEQASRVTPPSLLYFAHSSSPTPPVAGGRHSDESNAASARAAGVDAEGRFGGDASAAVGGVVDGS